MFHEELNRKVNVFLDTKNLAEFLKILYLLEVKSIELSRGGEPTLHPEFYELVKRASREGFEVVDHFTYV